VVCTNLRLYGDLTGLGPFVEIIGRRYPPSTLTQLWGEREGLALSYVGLFGWMNLPAPGWAVAVQGGILAMGWLAALWSLLRGVHSLRVEPGHGWGWGLVLVWPAALFVSLVRWTLLTPATQGRLLFPALGCLSLCAAYGWRQLVPRRWAGRATLGVIVAMTCVAVAMPYVTIAPAYRPPAAMSIEAIPVTAQRVGADLGGGVHLVAAELPTEPLLPGNDVLLTLFWQADAPVATDYAAYVHLIGADERIVAQRDRYPGRGLLPTSRMQSGGVYADQWAVRLPQTMLTPESLRVVVGLYESATGARPGQGVAIGELALPAREQAGVPNPLDIRLAGGIGLVGYSVDRTAALPGERIALTLYWRAGADGDENLSVFCQLQAQGGQIVAQHDGWPDGGNRPTSSWRKGDLIADRHVMIVKDDAPPGVWALHVGLYNADGKRLTVLGQHGEARAKDIVLTSIRVASP